ncbi:MAG: hypothetical protein NVSMB62_24020 [Acidobacteriaceae bacterium]
MRLKNFATSLVFVLITSVSLAQTSKGILAGTVRDASGAVIANATVTVTNQGTGENRTVTSGKVGEFRIDAINTGSYTLQAKAPGFDTAVVRDLPVKGSEVTTFDPKLQVGKTESVVTVEAGGNQINTENGQLSGTVNALELAKVPIFSLNPVELATTLPGVQTVNAGGTSNGVNIEVNGTRPRANNFLIDGQDINDNSIAGQGVQPTIPGIFSETVVLTNSSSAEYGRGAGAIVNLITRSGTNNFHGSAWDLYSGSGLNALDGVQRQGKSATTRKTRSDTHRYGFTVGGPILRNKLFGFAAAQYSRTYGKSQPRRLTLPDAAGNAILQRIGGAQVALLTLYTQGAVGIDPSTGPVQKTDIGTRAGCTAPCIVTYGYYTRPAPAVVNQSTQWAYKVDFIPRQEDTFAIRYLHNRNILSPDFFNFPGSLLNFDTNQGGPSEQFGTTYTHLFSPNLLNEFRASETRIDFRFGVTPTATAYSAFNLPSLTIENFPALGVPSNIPQGRGHDTYQFQDTVAWTRGRHSIRVGADVSRLIVRDFIPFNARGTLSFNQGGGFTSLGNFLDNFLGASGAANIVAGSNRVDTHVWQEGYFLQDDYKVSADFTANLGVRYEYDSNPENALKYPAIDPSNLKQPINTYIKVKEDYNNVAPRVGFAYNPHLGNRLFDGQTVFHGGFGVFFDTVFTNITDNSQASAPNAIAQTVTQTTGRGMPGATAIIPGLLAKPLPISPFASVTSVVKDQVNPYTYQYNFGMERELPAKLKLTVNYVGTRGLKLFQSSQYNYFDPATGKRLDPTRGEINARNNQGDSNYNSLQAELSRAYAHGIYATAAYTFGKALDDGTDIFGRFDQATAYSANLAAGARRFEYGRSAYDHRHNLSLTYVWELPSLHADNLFVNALSTVVLNHWVVSGTAILQSGPPTTLQINNLDTNGDGTANNDRPNIGNPNASIYTAAEDGALLVSGKNAITGATVPYQAGVLYDIVNPNPATKLYPVTTAAANHFLIQPGIGNVGRNSFPSPGNQFYNVAVEKNFSLPLPHLGESAFQVRVEAQDVGNHNNVGPYNTTVTNLRNGGGTAFSSFVNKSDSRQSDGRIVRIWAKYQF